MVAGTHAFTHMYYALIPLIYPFIVVEFGIGYAAIGLMELVSRFVGGLLQGPAGLLGRIIPRNILLGLNNILLALSMGFLGISPTYAAFFAANVLGRLAQTPQHPIGTSLISEWFGKKMRGITFAINYSGANAGGLIVPMIAAGLFTLIGWRGTIAVFAIPGLVFGGLTILMLTTAGKAVATEDGKSKLSGDLRKVLKDRNLLLTLIASSLSAGGRGLAVMHIFIPLYLSDTKQDGLGMDTVTVSILFTILLIGSVIGPLILGRVSDRYGRTRTISLILLMSGVFPILLILSGGNLSLIIPILLAIGFSSYTYSSLYQTMVADVAEPNIRDMAFSLYFFLSFGIGAIWTFLLALIADLYGFQPLFIISALAPLSALPFTLAVKERAES